MIKRGLVFFSALVLSLIIVSSFLTAAACSLNTSLINQDPYPATPGDYVKLVFQVNGLENSECGDVNIELLPTFPFSLDVSEQAIQSTKSGVYTRDYSSFLIAPYKVRVADTALDGDNPIETIVTSSSGVSLLSQFDINVKDKRTDFEIYVKDYVPATNIMTLEVINIGENDIKALTLEIPKQDAIVVKGANKNVLGDLDSNEYTTADFEVSSSSTSFDVVIYYTDTISVRRTVTKLVEFDKTYFVGRKADQTSLSFGNYVVILIILAGVGYFGYKRYKNSKHHKSA